MARKITEQDVRHVAKLSRLKLSDEQVSRFTSQLEPILEYVAMLEKLDVTDVEPMAHPLTITDVLRDDVERPGEATESMLASAPDHGAGFFKVPKVLGDGGGA